MKELKPIGSPLIRMRRINFSTSENIISGLFQLTCVMENHTIGISPDGLRVMLNITMKFSEQNKKVDGEFQMECSVKLAEPIPPEEFIKEKDMGVIQKALQNLFGILFDQMSLSISTIFAQFGLGAINLSKIIKLENIKITDLDNKETAK